MLARTSELPPPGRRYSFMPDFIVASVDDINFHFLAKQGISAALIDLDGTVVVRGKYDVSEEISQHLAHQPLRIYIATNRPQSRSLKNLKESLHAQGVIHPKAWQGKPLAQYYAAALRQYDLQASEVVMIGDRFLQDIFGANVAGLRTIAVRKFGAPVNPIDRFLSKIEKRFIDRLIKNYKPADDC